jgi:tRNA U34 5-methylaminomethyl-2-thiouridine-forming methyltransferase MnmC
MENKLQIHSQAILIQTDDGSSSLMQPDLGETYHSHFGAITESEHVFIRNGFLALNSGKPEICILEIGFGTALNALLTLANSKTNQKVHYTGIERFPVQVELAKQLNYCESADLQLFETEFQTMHQCDWAKETTISENFYLTKLKLDIESCFPESEQFDLIYFDAFSPNVQQELWKAEIFRRMFFGLKPGGFLVTYCAKGIVKEAMREAGFQVKRLPGPPGKRHMVKAIKM